MNKELLESYGINCEKGLQNCMGNMPFYKKIMSMFLQDECFAKARAAYLAGERGELFNRMHELKGVSGNAGLTALYEASVPLVELLRKGGAEQAEIQRLFVAAEEAYKKACEGIAIVVADMNA